MSETNVAVFSGTVGTDVDFRIIRGSQKAVAEVSIVNNKYRPNQQSDTGFDQYSTWVSVRFFTRLAEVAAEKLQKGMRITVSGELSEDVWQDSNNPSKKHRKLYIVANSFEVHKQVGEPKGNKLPGGPPNTQGSQASSGVDDRQHQSSIQQAPVAGQRPVGYNS